MIELKELSQPMRDYVEFLKRIQKKESLTLTELNSHRTCRDVGIYYGLTETEMDLIDWSEYE